MDSSLRNMLGLFMICIFLQDGSGLPLPDRLDVRIQAVPPHHIRTKRCSCNNWDDRECIYFCHLDIIWVNTPSKLLPYGLGGTAARRRRSTKRCKCHNPTDNSCHGFCQKSSENSRAVLDSLQKPTSTNSYRWLASLRSGVYTNVAKGVQSSSINSSEAKESKTMR